MATRQKNQIKRHELGTMIKKTTGRKSKSSSRQPSIEELLSRTPSSEGDIPITGLPRKRQTRSTSGGKKRRTRRSKK